VFAETLGLALAVRLLGPLAAPPPRPPRGLTAQQLRRVTDYIEDNLDRDLSLATIADIAGISASHLKTLFRRSLGQPVHTYVIHRRVERARAPRPRRDPVDLDARAERLNRAQPLTTSSGTRPAPSGRPRRA
jgi:AraC family transcriptional regulator